MKSNGSKFSKLIAGLVAASAFMPAIGGVSTSAMENEIDDYAKQKVNVLVDNVIEHLDNNMKKYHLDEEKLTKFYCGFINKDISKVLARDVYNSCPLGLMVSDLQNVKGRVGFNENEAKKVDMLIEKLNKISNARVKQLIEKSELSEYEISSMQAVASKLLAYQRLSYNERNDVYNFVVEEFKKYLPLPLANKLANYVKEDRSTDKLIDDLKSERLNYPLRDKNKIDQLIVELTKQSSNARVKQLIKKSELSEYEISSMQAVASKLLAYQRLSYNERNDVYNFVVEEFKKYLPLPLANKLANYVKEGRSTDKLIDDLKSERLNYPLRDKNKIDQLIVELTKQSL